MQIASHGRKSIYTRDGRKSAFLGRIPFVSEALGRNRLQLARNGSSALPSLTARSKTPHNARKETQRRRRSWARPCYLGAPANVFLRRSTGRGILHLHLVPFVDGEGIDEVRVMDLRRLLASALLSSPSRRASLIDCRATSVRCAVKSTSMMLRLTVVMGRPSCSPMSWRERLARWIATQSGHFRRNLAEVGTVRFTRDGFASEIP
jgi:hypothetical protein